jgi:hypothetical protein
MRQYVGMAVAGTLLLAAGLGLYWVLNMGRVQVANGTNAPQLTADSTVVKTKPDLTAQPVTDAANSPVLKQMEGVSQAPSAEQLVTTDQTAGQTEIANANAPAADSGENGLANRKVRTVTVRPDGTIVPGDDGVAGNEALAVDRPNVPLVPGSGPTDAASADQVAALPNAAGPVPPAAIPDSQSASAPDATASGDIQPVFNPSQVAPVPLSFPVRGASAGSTAPLALAATPKSSVNAVVGAQTPNGPINLLADNSALQPPPASAQAPLAPAPNAPSPAATPAAGGAAAYVQLASSTSASDASAAVKSATAKYGAIFGDNKLIVQQADLGSGKGMRWRVRLPVSSFSDATNVCAQIKAQGGDCFPTNG